MEFDSIGDFFGIATYSQNNEFTLITSSKGSGKPTLLLVANKGAEKPLYAYQVTHASGTAISNNGFSAALSYDEENDHTSIKCINKGGDLAFEKISKSIPSSLAFDNTGAYLVVSFCGEETNVECYSIVWFEVNTGILFKAQQTPELLPVDRISFDNKNRIKFNVF